jgi:hypothetical protein
MTFFRENQVCSVRKIGTPVATPSGLEYNSEPNIRFPKVEVSR